MIECFLVGTLFGFVLASCVMAGVVWNKLAELEHACREAQIRRIEATKIMERNLERLQELKRRMNDEHDDADWWKGQL